MKVRLSTKDMNEAIEKALITAGAQNPADGLRLPMPWSFRNYCKGSTWIIEFRPGFQLIIGEVNPFEDLLISLEEESMQFGVAICVSGKMRGTFRGQKDTLTMDQGQNSICFTPRSMKTMEYQGNQTNRGVTVRIEPRLLNTYLEGGSGHISDLRHIVDKTSASYYSRIGPATTSMRMTVHQILHCPYHDSIKRMYLESKAMELITHQLAQLAGADSAHKGPASLQADDIEKIHQAKDILVANFQHPPTIQQLSRQVGLNDFKLKNGFRRIYGTSIYQYLLDHRFDQARHLLGRGRLNVSEVARAIGYSKLDHFHRSFKKRFGVTPGVYRRDTQESC